VAVVAVVGATEHLLVHLVEQQSQKILCNFCQVLSLSPLEQVVTVIPVLGRVVVRHRFLGRLCLLVVGAVRVLMNQELLIIPMKLAAAVVAVALVVGVPLVLEDYLGRASLVEQLELVEARVVLAAVVRAL
jgi:hypothetical protein